MLRASIIFQQKLTLSNHLLKYIFIRFLDGMKANDYQEKIYCQVRNQLNAIALILEAVEQHTDSQRNNILVKPNVYISMILVRALENVSTNSKKQINHFTWICCGAALAFFFAARKMM